MAGPAVDAYKGETSLKQLTRFLALSVIALAACTPAPPAAQPGAQVQPAEVRADNQVLNIAASGMIGNPTPQASRTQIYQFNPMYDALTTFGPNFEVKPWAATSWSVSADALTWTFKMRSDLKFSNGDPLTAEDAAFTLTEIFAKTWPQASYMAGLKEAKAPNPTTLEIVLSRPNAAIPNGAPFIWIVPKKYYESVGFDGFLAKPIGSGPYVLENFQTANRIHYKLRPDAHAFRKPIATEIIIRLIPEATQIMNGLSGGEIDIAASVGWNGDQANALKNSGMNLIVSPGASAQIAMPQGSYEGRDTPLKDKRVRQALNYALNKDAWVTGLYGGFAEPTGQLAQPDTPYSDPSVKPYPYDVAKAKQLLAEAGYPNGFKLPQGLDYSSGRNEQNMIVAFQADMKAIGVEFELIANEESVFVDKAYGRRNLPKGDFWSGSNNEDNGFFTGVRTFYGCDKPVGGHPGSRLYCNPVWDRLMDEAYGEPDPAKRHAIFLKANETFRNDVPAVFTVTKSSFNVSTSKIKGIDLPTPNFMMLDGVYKIK